MSPPPEPTDSIEDKLSGQVVSLNIDTEGHMHTVGKFFRIKALHPPPVQTIEHTRQDRQSVRLAAPA